MIMKTIPSVLTNPFGQEISQSSVTFEYSHAMPWVIRCVFYNVDDPTEYRSWDILRDQILKVIDTGRPIENTVYELGITDDDFVFTFWYDYAEKEDNHVNVHVDTQMFLSFLNRTLDDVLEGSEQFDWDSLIDKILS